MCISSYSEGSVITSYEAVVEVDSGTSVDTDNITAAMRQAASAGDFGNFAVEAASVETTGGSKLINKTCHKVSL